MRRTGFLSIITPLDCRRHPSGRLAQCQCGPPCDSMAVAPLFPRPAQTLILAVNVERHLWSFSHASWATFILCRRLGPAVCGLARVRARLADTAGQIHPDAWTRQWRRYQRATAGRSANQEMGAADRHREPARR